VLKHFFGGIDQIGVLVWFAQEVQQVAGYARAELHVIGAVDYHQVRLAQAGASVAVLVVTLRAEGDDLFELVSLTFP
jgi:hypothetical protein